MLFARHRTLVYRWLHRFVGNETVAEDLLSDNAEVVLEKKHQNEMLRDALITVKTRMFYARKSSVELVQGA